MSYPISYDTYDHLHIEVLAVTLTIAGMLQRHELPPGTVRWSVIDTEGFIGPTLVHDAAEFQVRWDWTPPGIKRVDLKIGESTNHLYVNVPNTGSLDFTKPSLSDPDPPSNGPLKSIIGLTDYVTILAAGAAAADWVINRYGQDSVTGETRQDAIRHSSWNAISAMQVGKPKTIIFTTANEYHNEYFTNGTASNSTMDLHNNDVGATFGDTLFDPPVFRTANEMINAMEAKFKAGELWAWTPPNANVNTHSGILKKSNQTRIFPP